MPGVPVKHFYSTTGETSDNTAATFFACRWCTHPKLFLLLGYADSCEICAIF